MRKKRHTPAEIAAKLQQADEWASQGRLHGDIAKTLGVSLMTYHRWRKARAAAPGHAAQPVEESVESAPLAVREQMERISELQLENSRLRRLVTDLLLEKVKLEENLRGTVAPRGTAVRN
jgi:putative transposase